MSWPTDNMQVVTLILLVIITSAASAASALVQKTCPEVCRCFNHQVDCSGRSISNIPSVIPKGTVTFSLVQNDISEVSSIDFPVALLLLQSLLLRDNAIRAVQRQALVNLPALQSLDLEGNRIRVIEPRTFEGCAKLTRLVLDHNLIDYVYAESFYGLESLVELRMEANNIQIIDVEAFQQTPKLEKLYLNDNKFLELPASGPIFKALSLLTLEMDNCNITGLTPKAFEYAPNIVYLKMRGNYLQREDLRSVVRLKSLKFLHLEFNAISYIHPNAFDGINLEWLYLTGNEIYMSRNHPFLYTQFLVTLDISFCGIKDIHPGAFTNFTRMKGLKIKENHLTTFSIDSKLDSLASLDLSHNKIMYLEPAMFTRIPNLMFLDVSFNFINEIDPETFTANTKLSYLGLQGNQLIVPESGILFSSHSMLSLDLSACGIGAISATAFVNMTNLKELKLSQNALETVSFSGSLSKLTNLDISRNRITKFQGSHFLGMKSLSYINVSKNPIDCESFQATWFWCTPTPVNIEAECTITHNTGKDAYSEKCKEAQQKKDANDTDKVPKKVDKPKSFLSIDGVEAGPDVARTADKKPRPVMNISMRIINPNADIEVVDEISNDTSGNYIQLNDSSSYNISSVVLESKESTSTWWILAYVCVGSVSFLVLVFATTLSLDWYCTRRRRKALKQSASLRRSNSRAQASKHGADGKDPALRPLQGNFRRQNSARRQKRQRDSITSISRSSGEHPRYISAPGKDPEDSAEPVTYRPHELWSRQFREPPQAGLVAQPQTSVTDNPLYFGSVPNPSAPGYPASNSWSRNVR